MATVSFDNGYGRTYTFEIVDKIPEGYEVWNIDFDKLGKDLVPLCKCYEGTYNVILDELKAIRIVDEYERMALKTACSWGFDKDSLENTLREWGMSEEDIKDRIRLIDSAERILERNRG